MTCVYNMSMEYSMIVLHAFVALHDHATVFASCTVQSKDSFNKFGSQHIEAQLKYQQLMYTLQSALLTKLALDH